MASLGKLLKSNVRNRLLGGMLVVVPLGATIILLKFVFITLDGFLAPLLIRFLGYTVPGLGLLVMLLGLYLLGALTANVLGRRVLGFGENLVTKVPLVRGIYSSSKLLVESLATPSGNEPFSSVVLIEYPRRGLYTLAFLTNENVCQLQNGDHMVSVFVPTTPNPTSGFMLLLSEQDVIPSSFTVEEGVKMVVSGGIIAPDPTRFPTSAALSSASLSEC